MEPETVPGPSMVPEKGKSQALLQDYCCPKAYPTVKFSFEQVSLVEVALPNAILSSETAEAPWFDGIYHERGTIV